MNSRTILFLSKVADIKAQATTAQELRKDAPSIAEMIQRYLNNPAVSVSSWEQPRSWKEAKRDAKTSHYLTVVEVSQIANQRRRDAEERAAERDNNEQQRKSELIHPDSIERKTRRDELRQNAFERMNVTVGHAGYLLYTYDKTGEHSIMGDEIVPGTYGDQITYGDFTEDA